MTTLVGSDDDLPDQIAHGVTGFLCRSDQIARDLLAYREQPVKHLAALGSIAEHMSAATLSGVIEARKAGASWTVIGDALGMTRQAAHERFSKYTD